MTLLFDIGNTNTHLGLADSTRVTRQKNIPTNAWFDGSAEKRVLKFVGSARVEGLGIALVERIESDDPTALIGLPLIALVGLLRDHGLDVV